MSGGQRDPEAIKNMTAVACVMLCVFRCSMLPPGGTGGQRPKKLLGKITSN